MFLAHAVNFLSAIWFINRIWRIKRAQNVVIVGILTIITEAVVTFWSPMMSLTVPIWFIVIALGWRKWSLWSENRAANSSLRRILDEIILEMRSGRAFRPALANALNGHKCDQVALQIELWLQAKSLGRPQPSGPDWWSMVVIELNCLDRQSHQAVQRLLQWRSRIKLESDFRRRCGQVMAQIRLQVLILSVIYIALTAFALRAGLLQTHPSLLAVSMGLFCLGVTAIFRIGGRLKWNF